MTAAESLVMPDSSVTVPSSADFETVYAMHFQFVWRCLRGLGVAPGSLDDAAQEVFIVVHRRWADFRGASSLRTWLYGIVRNVASNHRRAARRQPTDRWPPELELPSAAPDAHEHIAERELASFVHTFLAGLDEPKRDMFVLAMLEEISLPEVAEMLEIPINTAYTRLRRVRLAFQRAWHRRQLAP